MKIVTKFNVGDTVYTIDKETMKLKEFEVSYVSVFSTKNEDVRISYGVKCDSYKRESYDARVCFASKDDLLDYVTQPRDLTQQRYMAQQNKV